jgi:hypothetical protein
MSLQGECPYCGKYHYNDPSSPDTSLLQRFDYGAAFDAKFYARADFERLCHCDRTRKSNFVKFSLKFVRYDNLMNKKAHYARRVRTLHIKSRFYSAAGSWREVFSYILYKNNT